MGADCTQWRYAGLMAKVIQIRDMPDDAHASLVRAASERGMSLSRYVRNELEVIARRADAARRNAEVTRATKKAVGVTVDRSAIAAALDADRR